jgi:hypothetical protein
MSFKRVCRCKALLRASCRASTTHNSRNTQHENLLRVVLRYREHEAAENNRVRPSQHKYPYSEMPLAMSHVARLSRSLWLSRLFAGRALRALGSVMPRATFAWAGAIALAPIVACAAPAGPRAEYPRSETICQYVGLESVETPQQTDTDSSSFVAVYRFREPHEPAPEQPVKLKFQVNRSRMAELQTHLESQPEVVCSPDNDRHFSPRVRPLPEPQGALEAPAARGQATPPGAVPTPPQAAPEPAPAVGPNATY